MKSLSRRKVDDEGGRKAGRKAAKDGPGFQVDGPREAVDLEHQGKWISAG